MSRHSVQSQRNAKPPRVSSELLKGLRSSQALSVTDDAWRAKRKALKALKKRRRFRFAGLDKNVEHIPTLIDTRQDNASAATLMKSRVPGIDPPASQTGREVSTHPALYVQTVNGFCFTKAPFAWRLTFR